MNATRPASHCAAEPTDQQVAHRTAQLNRRRALGVLLASTAAALQGGCASQRPAAPPPAPAAAVTYRDVGSVGLVAGVGTESQDIVAVTDAMVRDLLSSPFMAGLSRAPVILIDSERFSIEGQRINKALIIDRLRIHLQRASRGRLMFVSREAAADVATERDLKERRVTDAGTRNLGDKVAGLDYRMYGRMAVQDKRAGNGMVERYTQFSFELVDQQRSLSVWANSYEFQKAGRDDAVYR